MGAAVEEHLTHSREVLVWKLTVTEMCPQARHKTHNTVIYPGMASSQMASSQMLAEILNHMTKQTRYAQS